MVRCNDIRDLNLRRIFISSNRQYVWVFNPKVGTTTIKELIAYDEGLAEPGSIEQIHGASVFDRVRAGRYRKNKGELVEILNGKYFRFCFVRNPYTRLLSAYRNKIDSEIGRVDLWRGKPKRQILEALGMDPKNVNAAVTFESFVDAINAVPVGELDPHWRPQYSNLMCNILDYDHVARFEQFASEMNYIVSRCGMTVRPDALPHRKESSKRSRKKISDTVINKRSAKIIRSIFAKDFEYFGYNPDDIPV